MNSAKWFAREWLELKRIVNVARGADPGDWPLPDEWAAALVHIETAIDQGRIEYARHPNGLISFTRIRVEGLWAAIQGRQCQAEDAKDVQAALEEFCCKWAEVQNVDLSSGPKTLRRRPISETALRDFYDEHVDGHRDDDVPPSSADDLKAAYQKFGPVSEVFVGRDAIRSLRAEKAPPRWRARGRRPARN